MTSTPGAIEPLKRELTVLVVNSTESIVVVEDTVDFDEDTVVVEVAVAVVVDSVVVEGGFLEIHTALT